MRLLRRQEFLADSFRPYEMHNKTLIGRKFVVLGHKTCLRLAVWDILSSETLNQPPF